MGAYLSYDFILTTENGIEITNTIVMDTQVLNNFLYILKEKKIINNEQ